MHRNSILRAIGRLTNSIETDCYGSRKKWSFWALVRDFSLYLFGLLGLVFSGVAAMGDLNFANLAVVTAAAGTLLGDYFLQEHLKKGDRPERPDRGRWNVLKWSGLALGIISIPLIDMLYPSADRIPPEVQVVWYSYDSGRLQLSDPSKVIQEISPSDVLNNSLALPVRLAVRNVDDQPLKVTRIELNYRAVISVDSQGQPRIDPRGKRLIYEHDLGTLESRGNFTPIREVDLLRIPFSFLFVTAVAITQDDVPTRFSTLVGEDVFAKPVVQIEVRILSEDRPPATGVVRIFPEVGVQLFSAFDVAHEVDPLFEDLRYFLDDLGPKEVLGAWRRIHKESSRLVRYQLAEINGEKVLRVWVEGKIRHVSVDNDLDGNVDFMLIKGKPDEKIRRFNFQQNVPLTEWNPIEVAEP